ncbi:MAG: 6-phosphogluconate dehydrogenase, decarboxylating [Oscillospiraceae bacterium]|jgi:6-phosphogluconate dehydrogenase
MPTCSIGMYGLGVMGKSLAVNFIKHGIPTALYSKSDKERENFSCPDCSGSWVLCQSEKEFVQSIRTPRVIFLMITAGKPVDEVITSLSKWMEPGDVLIDGGNSYYEDTNRRCQSAANAGIHFLGVGVSGGEKGALNGPSMMVGGNKEGWSISKKYLQTIAAKAPDGAPCCDYVGPEGAGHYVKMVHNGIEYAFMQQIADIYAILRDGMRMDALQIAQVIEGWRHGPLESYLIDITSAVLRKRDADGSMLIDHVLDVAMQKGTGSWCVLEAVRRGVYIPCIDEALFARYFSSQREERRLGKQLLPYSADKPMEFQTKQLEKALYLSVVCSFAQGISLIRQASQEFKWDVNLARVVALWQNGCIIRSTFLTKMIAALEKECPNLLLSEEFHDACEMEHDLRQVIAKAIKSGIAIPAITGALLYYDACRTERMSLNMVQALRDCFGAHKFTRIDRPGLVHSDWDDDSFGHANL